MFSIQIANPNGPKPARAGLGRVLIGKAIGFAAGLALIAALDALLLHHVLWRSISDAFALHQPTIVDAVRAAWAGLTIR